MFRNICWAFSGSDVLSEEKVDYIMEKGLSAQEQVATHQLPDLKKSQDQVRTHTGPFSVSLKAVFASPNVYKTRNVRVRVRVGDNIIKHVENNFPRHLYTSG